MFIQIVQINDIVFTYAVIKKKNGVVICLTIIYTILTFYLMDG